MTLFEDDVPMPAAPAGPLVRVRLTVAYHGAGFRGMAAQPGQRTVAGVLAAVLGKVVPSPPAPEAERSPPAPEAERSPPAPEAGQSPPAPEAGQSPPAPEAGQSPPAPDAERSPPAPEAGPSPPGSKAERGAVEVAVAGRTDAGVHAWGQVVAFDAPAGLDVAGLARRLNKLLAPEVVVRAASVAADDFDPRRWATGRRYRYTVLNRPEPDPWLADTAWWVAAPLDLRTMRAGCDPLLGQHDFSSFCRKQGDASLVRVVREADWLDLGDGLLRFEIEASSFCQQMVRAVVGMLVDVGLGKRTAADVNLALRARNRSAAGQVAPPHGLCLWDVTYGDGPRQTRPL